MTNAYRIIVTRPLAQGQPLADKLSAKGYSVALFPLLDIFPLPEQSELQHQLHLILANLSRFALVSFVSPNAVHAAVDGLKRLGLGWPEGVAIAVVGEGSKAALAEHGITSASTRIYCPTDPARSDSESLLEELDLPSLKGREVLILRAETGRELLAEAFIAHGIEVVKVVAYRRLTPLISTQNNPQLAELVKNQLSGLLSAQSVWVVSSSEALRTLVELTEKLIGIAGVVKLQQVNLLVSHQRIAETAEKCQFKCVRQIGSGDENLLLALQSYL